MNQHTSKQHFRAPSLAAKLIRPRDLSDSKKTSDELSVARARNVSILQVDERLDNFTKWKKKRKSRERENKTKIPLRAVARQKVTGSSRHRSAADHCLSLRTPFVKCRIIPSNSFFWIRFPFYLPPPPHAPLVYPPPARTAICRCSRALPSAGAHAHSTATG